MSKLISRYKVGGLQKVILGSLCRSYYESYCSGDVRPTPDFVTPVLELLAMTEEELDDVLMVYLNKAEEKRFCDRGWNDE